MWLPCCRLSMGQAFKEECHEEEIRTRYKEVFQRHFPNEAYRELQFVLRFGDPATQIASYAAARQIGLIVMPSHGWTGLDHLLLGSVAERTLRLASCPVLVLRGAADRIPCNSLRLERARA